MIVEIEIIEQIEDEPVGRTVRWVYDFVRSLGKEDPSSFLRFRTRAAVEGPHP